mmetsp:Transcript_43190/g.109095  ORF Transcript_43190/g.109095 Transcript_43190/m.109095 type:complete len:201 (+) Transcript_43190:238-840(+)
MAPLMPTPMYRSGAMILPVWPICQSFGQYPASTAARDAPTPAPTASARSSISLKFSLLLTPRPPATTRGADARSGRAELAMLAPAKVDNLASGAASACSITADPPSASALSKALGLTVTTLTASLLFTVASTEPAYIGRTNVESSLTLTMSEIWFTSRRAATRGRKDFPNTDAGARMWVYGFFLWNCSTRAAMFSGRPWS